MSSGITHFTDLASYVALMPEPIPFRPFWVIISGVVELIGAWLIVSNRMPELGGWLIFLFLVPVTIVVHGVAGSPGLLQLSWEAAYLHDSHWYRSLARRDARDPPKTHTH